MPQELKCQAGQQIITQNAPSFDTFFIKSGLVEVSVEREDAEPMILGTLGPGETFGEMGVLEQTERMANVVALEPCVLSVFSKKELDEKLGTIDDSVINSLLDGLCRRLRESDEAQLRHYTNLTEFQNRMTRISGRAKKGIDQEKREEFSTVVKPLLDQLESALIKYQE